MNCPADTDWAFLLGGKEANKLKQLVLPYEDQSKESPRSNSYGTPEKAVPPALCIRHDWLLHSATGDSDGVQHRPLEQCRLISPTIPAPWRHSSRGSATQKALSSCHRSFPDPVPGTWDGCGKVELHTCINNQTPYLTDAGCIEKGVKTE